MKKNTRQKIIETGISLFNQYGYGAISLQEIAQNMGISRGNLTYHFKTKDNLLQVIADEMWAKQKIERQKRRDFPSFKNLENELKMYYALQKEYAFIFNDLHVIKHPVLEEKFRTFSLRTIKDNQAAIAFSIRLGNMKSEPFAGAYYNLCLSLWMISLFWLTQKIIRNSKEKKEIGKVAWSLILPHFTAKGIESFKAHYGEDYYNSMGMPFNVELDMAFF